jgi:hypothetical protein
MISAHPLPRSCSADWDGRISPQSVSLHGTAWRRRRRWWCPLIDARGWRRKWEVPEPREEGAPFMEGDERGRVCGACDGHAAIHIPCMYIRPHFNWTICVPLIKKEKSIFSHPSSLDQ